MNWPRAFICIMQIEIGFLNNPFLKSEKGLYKIVFEIYFSNNPLARKAL
jgi:uncharacterized membrane protein YiaA